MPGGMRPTSDKVREALFNIIKDMIRGASVLDLFAGSGALGLEALSRGAERVTFVDSGNRCIHAIKKNVNTLQVNENHIEIIKDDVFRAIKKLSDSKIRFNIVFLDPPYYANVVKKCLIYLYNHDILYHSSFIICEHYKKDAIPNKIEDLEVSRQYRYGDTVLSVFKRREK